MTWHAPDDLLLRFGTAPETLDDVSASSVEAHLVDCASCRAALAAAVATAAPEVVEDSWDAVADRIDRPRRSIVERFLVRIGVADHQARLVAATRALQARWLLTILALIAASVLASHENGSDGPFLLVAPLVPLLAVGIAFAGGGDPAGESAAATPVAGIGLVLRRAVSVLAVVLPALVVGTLAMPVFEATAAAWVLPAFALTLGALALSRWFRIEVAAGALAGLWYGSLITALVLKHAPNPQPADLAPLALPGQVAALVVIAVAGAALVVRRDLLLALAGRTP